MSVPGGEETDTNVLSPSLSPIGEVGRIPPIFVTVRLTIIQGAFPRFPLTTV